MPCLCCFCSPFHHDNIIFCTQVMNPQMNISNGAMLYVKLQINYTSQFSYSNSWMVPTTYTGHTHSVLSIYMSNPPIHVLESRRNHSYKDVPCVFSYLLYVMESAGFCLCFKGQHCIWAVQLSLLVDNLWFAPKSFLITTCL